MHKKETLLFSSELDNIGYAILSDDLDSFKKEYKKNIIIDNKKLMLFCMESMAYSIVNFLLIKKKNEYNKLNYEEKIVFFIDLSKRINNKFQIKQSINIFNYINKNYVISKKLRQSLMLIFLKYGLFDNYKILAKKDSLNQKNLFALLAYMKIDKYCKKKHEFYKSIFLKKILKNKNHKYKLYKLFNVLTINLGGLKDESGFSFEILIYKSLPNDLKEKWREYLFNNNNLMFYTFNISNYARKKDGYNTLNLNLDFIYFFIDIVLSEKTDLTDVELQKMFYLEKYINNDDLSIILNYNAFAGLRSIVHKNVLERELSKKEVSNKKTIIKI